MSHSEIVENNTDNINGENKDEKKKLKVCVCRVPESLRSGHPEAFTPNFVGLGPYHHTRTDLTMTDEVKSAATTKKLDDKSYKIPFSDDVQPFYHEEAFSSCEHKDDQILKDHQIVDGIITDGLFLLTLLYRSLDAQQDAYFFTGKHGMPLVNKVGVELTINAIIRDVFMLENQIPTHVLLQINQATSDHSHDLGEKMQSFCQTYCPLVNCETLSKNAQEYDHLLDLMYHMVGPKPDPDSAPKPENNEKPEESAPVSTETPEESAPVTTEKPEESLEVTTEKPEESLEVTIEKPNAGNTDNAESPDKSRSKTKINRCGSLLDSIGFSIFVFIVILCYIVYIIWKIICGVFRFLYGILKRVLAVFVKLLTFCQPLIEEAIGALPPSQQQKFAPFINRSKETGETIQHHFLEEKDTRPAVTIQSVTELDGAGIQFEPAEGGIKDLKFVGKQLFLPVIRVDENSEVIMRNLVAYESLSRPTYLIFTRYVEIMRAIIDTPEDVNLLVNKNIIVTELSDKVVADLFNGMSTSIRPTNTPELEDVINKVKTKFEDSQWLQSQAKICMKYSWKIVRVIAALSFLILTVVQTYCSINGCASRSSSTFGRLPAVSDNGLISSI